jgi:hypothetical protein
MTISSIYMPKNGTSSNFLNTNNQIKPSNEHTQHTPFYRILRTLSFNIMKICFKERIS